MGILKFCKKVVVVATACLTLFTSITSCFVYAEDEQSGGSSGSSGSSNTRLQTAIKWSQEKSFNEMGAEDLSSLTTEDLRMIGVYLSNFYVPYSTALGKSSEEGELMSEMANALVKYGGFDKEVADKLVPMIWQMTLDTAKPVHIGVLEYDKDGNKIIRKASENSDKLVWAGLENADTDDDGKEDALKGSYYNFLACWSGHKESLKDGKDAGIDYDDTVAKEHEANCVLFWSDSGTDHIVFDSGGISLALFADQTNMQFEDMVAVSNWCGDPKCTGTDKKCPICTHKKAENTAMKITDSTGDGITGYESNNCNTGFETTKRAFSASSLAYGMLMDSLNYNNGYGASIISMPDYESYKSLSGEQKELPLMYSSQLYVDCFGNILVDNAVNQYVLVPACVNPYAWYIVEEGAKSAGDTINLVNSFMLGEAQNKRISYNGTRFKYLVYAGECSLFNLNYWRVYHGNDRIDIDADENNKEEEALQNLAGKLATKLSTNQSTGDERLFYPSWGTYPLYRYNKEISGYAQAMLDNESKSRISPIQKILMIDQYQTYKAEDGSIEDSSVIEQLDIFAKPEEQTDEAGNKTTPESYAVLSEFGNTASFGSVNKDNTLTSLKSDSASKAYYVSIYLSYVFAYYDDSTGADRKLPWAYNKEAFPQDFSSIDWSDIDFTSNQLDNEIKSLIYYILHPTEGVALAVTVVKNKFTGIIVDFHMDMVGNAEGVSTTGSTKYIGFSGYVTIPNLSDLAWTDWLLNQYDSLVVYFIVVIILVMLGYVMLGTLSLQRAITGVLIFAFCAYLPPKLIDTTVNTSNIICDSIYSSKFTYWALTQHYQYQSELKSAMTSSDKDQYLTTILKQQVTNNSDDYAVVTLKWQCPKKENFAADVRKEVTEMSGNVNVFKMISGLVSEQMSGQNYSDVSNDLYLYRSYTDLAAYSQSMNEYAMYYIPNNFSFLYEPVTCGLTEEASNSNIKNYFGIDSGSEYSLSNMQAREQGFLLGDTSFDTGFIDAYANTCWAYIYAPMMSHTMNSAITNGLGDIAKDDFDLFRVEGGQTKGVLDSMFTLSGSYSMNYKLCGVPTFKYNNTVASVNKKEMKYFPDTSSGGASAVDKDNMTSSERRKAGDAFGMFSFGCYSESPYYYLSGNLYSQLDYYKKIENPSATYKDLFLLKNGGYFYNLSSGAGTGYGEMRDFMDMRSLFTVVIPYLKNANDTVVAWDNMYGLWLYDDIDIDFDENYAFDVPDDIIVQETGGTDHFDASYLQKYWHNANVVQLLNMYTPWVDTMYSCEYAEPETIYVAGEKFLVTDPLNPESYYKKTGSSYEGRPMIFSRSEMNCYGLEIDDLTTVEAKIIKMYDELYEDLLILMDYYNFGDDVINTGAAMLETFAFNKQFSETNFIGEDYTLYPQSYELKNFSYDAFLRLILAETTGEDLAASYQEDGSLYHTVVKNSSVLTGLLFIVVDFFAVYAIPALKLFFLLAIFAVSVLVILCATIRMEISLPKVLWKSLVSPLLKFFGITIGMAFVVSLFMSDGNTAVTGRGGFTISLGDPVMVLIVMIIVNAVCLYLYWKTVKSVFKECVKYAKAVAQSVSGMVGGLIVGGIASATAGKSRVTADSFGGGSSASARGVSNTERHAKGGGLGSKVKSGAKAGAKTAALGVGAGIGAAAGAGMDKIKYANSAEGKLNKYNKKVDQYKNNSLKTRAEGVANKGIAKMHDKKSESKLNSALKWEERAGKAKEGSMKAKFCNFRSKRCMNKAEAWENRARARRNKTETDYQKAKANQVKYAKKVKANDNKAKFKSRSKSKRRK